MFDAELNLFSKEYTNCDFLYRAVQDNPDFADIKEHVSELWKTYHPYAEPQFSREFSRHFLQRYWELWLGVKFIAAGLTLNRNSGKGPDFDLKLSSGLHFYVEATAIEAGSTEDRVPPPPQAANNEDAPYPPIELFLRITGAIKNKSEQRKKQIDRGTLDSNRPYILAINVGDIPSIFVDENPPTLSHVCLGFGGVAYSGSSTLISPFPFIYRKKYLNDPISTRIFYDPEYKWISGIFLSDVNPFYLPQRNHIQFLHNPNADIRIPLGWFPYGSEWYCNNQKLINHK